MNPLLTPAETLAQRVRRTLDDLVVIRQALQSPDISIEADPLLDASLAAELKCAVDVLRQLLWAYIQAISIRSGRNPEEILECYKMEIAVAMLRTISSRKNGRPESSSGFEHLLNNALHVISMHIGTGQQSQPRAEI
jgi:hypothetical protein